MSTVWRTHINIQQNVITMLNWKRLRQPNRVKSEKNEGKTIFSSFRRQITSFCCGRISHIYAYIQIKWDKNTQNVEQIYIKRMAIKQQIYIDRAYTHTHSHQVKIQWEMNIGYGKFRRCVLVVCLDVRKSMNVQIEFVFRKRTMRKN